MLDESSIVSKSPFLVSSEQQIVNYTPKWKTFSRNFFNPISIQLLQLSKKLKQEKNSVRGQKTKYLQGSYLLSGKAI